MTADTHSDPARRSELVVSGGQSTGVVHPDLESIRVTEAQVRVELDERARRPGGSILLQAELTRIPWDSTVAGRGRAGKLPGNIPEKRASKLAASLHRQMSARIHPDMAGADPSEHERRTKQMVALNKLRDSGYLTVLADYAGLVVPSDDGSKPEWIAHLRRFDRSVAGPLLHLAVCHAAMLTAGELPYEFGGEPNELVGEVERLPDPPRSLRRGDAVEHPNLGSGEVLQAVLPEARVDGPGGYYLVMFTDQADAVRVCPVSGGLRLTRRRAQ